jgi:hypothetical protein
MFGRTLDSRLAWALLAALSADDRQGAPPSNGILAACLSAFAFGYLKGEGQMPRVGGAPGELIAGGLLACGAMTSSGARPFMLGLAQGALGTHFAALGATLGNQKKRRHVASYANGQAHTDTELATMIREALASE